MAKRQFRVKITTKGSFEVEVASVDTDEYNVDEITTSDAQDLLDNSEYIVNGGLGLEWGREDYEWKGPFELTVYDENDEEVFKSKNFSDFLFVSCAENFLEEIDEEEYAQNVDLQNTVAEWEKRWRAERKSIKAGTYIAAFHEMKWMTYTFVVEDEEFAPDKLLFLLNKAVEGLAFDYMTDPDHIVYDGGFVEAEDSNDVIEEYGTSFYIVKKWEDADWENIREI